jgi:hypothetical protein
VGLTVMFGRRSSALRFRVIGRMIWRPTGRM